MSQTHSFLRQLIKSLFLLLILLPLMMYHVAYPAMAASPESRRSFVNKRIATYDSWLNAPWSDNDVPYQALRKSIDTALAQASYPTAIVQLYEDQLTKRPTDPKALFVYSYSVYKAAGLPNGLSYAQSQLKSDILYTSITTSKLQPPHTYNYSRLAFLESAIYKSPDIISIGKRLLNHSPNDDEVENSLATVMTFSKVPADRNQAMSYQQDLARRFPNDPRPYRLLGIIYYRTAWLNHNQGDADKSIAAYQRALELSPKDQATRSEYDMIIKFIKNLQTQWKQNG